MRSVECLRIEQKTPDECVRSHTTHEVEVEGSVRDFDSLEHRQRNTNCDGRRKPAVQLEFVSAGEGDFSDGYSAAISEIAKCMAQHRNTSGGGRAGARRARDGIRILKECENGSGRFGQFRFFSRRCILAVDGSDGDGISIQNQIALKVGHFSGDGKNSD